MPTAVPTTVLPLRPPSTAYHLVRPFALMAAIAFVLGFAGYVALAHPVVTQAEADQPAVIAPVAAAPASDDWNLPKHI